MDFSTDIFSDGGRAKAHHRRRLPLISRRTTRSWRWQYFGYAVVDPDFRDFCICRRGATLDGLVVVELDDLWRVSLRNPVRLDPLVQALCRSTVSRRDTPDRLIHWSQVQGFPGRRAGCSRTMTRTTGLVGERIDRVRTRACSASPSRNRFTDVFVADVYDRRLLECILILFSTHCQLLSTRKSD